MIEFCPECEKYQSVIEVDKNLWKEYSLKYNGKIYNIRAEYYKCTICGEEFERDRNINRKELLVCSIWDSKESLNNFT